MFPERILTTVLSLLLLPVLCFACGDKGAPPVLQQVGDQLVAVNQELVISLSASDEDGDEIFYSFSSTVPEIESRASLNRLPIGTSEFRWTPEARDVGVWFFDFTASDGNSSDVITIRVEVRGAIGGNSSPKFIHPQGSGTTLDLETNRCLTLQVEILDVDTTEVAIAQAAPVIEGATLDIVSGTEAEWKWCPTEQQIAETDRYTLLLTADDGDNPQTLHPYLLVLQSPLKPNCPGDPPVILHTASDISSLSTLRIDATITDDVGLKQEPLLYYSATEPSTPPDLSEMIQVIMEEEADDHWIAQVPNPVVGQSAGSSAEVFYLIQATDDDDATGNCDHRSSGPSSGSFKMVVTNPGGEGGSGVCEACTADVQCGTATDHCVLVGNNSESFCLEGCSPGDCPANFECAAEPLLSVEGASGRQCVPVSLDCSDPGGGVCNDDSFENNDSRIEASLAAVFPANMSHSLVSCPAASGVGDDEDFFHLEITEDTQVQVQLMGGEGSDLDLQLMDSNGDLLASSVTLTSVESVSQCLAAGTYFLRVFAFGQAENPYSLQYTTTALSCGPVCSDDDNEEDDDATQARTIDLTGAAVSFVGQQICADDQDWYEVPLIAGQLISVDLTFVQVANGDLDIHLFDSDSVDLTPCTIANSAECDAENGQSGTDNESAIFAAPSSGIFYIVIQGFDGDSNSYDIVLETD